MIDAAQLTSASSIKRKKLSRWSLKVSSGRGYERVLIPQKRRRPREVLQPTVELDRVLKQLRMGLARTSGYVAPTEVHGFVKRRGIVTNASQHLNQDVVLRVDVKDFFGAIGSQRVKSTLTLFDFDEECAELVSAIATVDDGLAQGFSTSPLLSNMAFLETDRALAIVASTAGIRYTRYVDDMVFSGRKEQMNDDLLQTIQSRLGEFGWTLNETKTRFMRRGRPQFVTGLYVGDSAGPHIPRTMKRLLRREVYFASKFGLFDARTHSPTPMSLERLAGWIHYAAHVDPTFGEPLRRVWQDVAPSYSTYLPGEAWDLLLSDIGLLDT